MTTGEDVLVEDAATLDEPIRSEAMALGLGPLWVRPVEDPHGGERAAVVAWCGSSRPNNAFHRYALGRMEKALALVLLWRHKLVGLRRAASEDSLTGLANRAAFFEALGAACDAATRSGHAVGVLYIDLDGFKSVNDQHGHMRGDHLLAAVAGRIAGAVRGGATVGRLGGDEFGVLVPEAPDPTLLDDMAERVLHALTDPVTVGARSIQPAASIGSATSATAGLDPDGLVDAADRALYVAKREGRGRWARHEA